jgi:hypothetical protein
MHRKVAVAAIMALAAGAQAIGAQEVQPLDPLTPREVATADSVARTDSRVRDFLGGRSRVINVGFAAPKTEMSMAAREDVPSKRHAEVTIYHYDRDQGLLALVDISGRRVVDIARVRGQTVPINADEVAEAARLAVADAGVRRLFGERMPNFRVGSRAESRGDNGAPIIEGLRTGGGPSTDPCSTHRCIALFFRVSGRYVQMNRVVVDMNSQRVLIRGGER